MSGSAAFSDGNTKGKHKSLNAAYSQLVRYQGDLENPPLLVTCDHERFEFIPTSRARVRWFTALLWMICLPQSRHPIARSRLGGFAGCFHRS